MTTLMQEHHSVQTHTTIVSVKNKHCKWYTKYKKSLVKLIKTWKSSPFQPYGSFSIEIKGQLLQ